MNETYLEVGPMTKTLTRQQDKALDAAMDHWNSLLADVDLYNHEMYDGMRYALRELDSYICAGGTDFTGWMIRTATLGAVAALRPTVAPPRTLPHFLSGVRMVVSIVADALGVAPTRDFV